MLGDLWINKRKRKSSEAPSVLLGLQDDRGWIDWRAKVLVINILDGRVHTSIIQKELSIN